MKYQKKGAAKEYSIPISLAVGLMAGWITTLLLSTVIATMIAGERLQEDSISITAVITIVLASFIAAMYTAKYAGRNKLGMCIVSGGLYYLSLLCCTALSFGGSYCGLGSGVLTIIGSATVAGLLSIRQKKHKTRYLK